MAKRANYGFEKRQKELKRQQRKNEKDEKKRLKKESALGPDQGDVTERVEDVVRIDGHPAAPDETRDASG